MKKEQVQVGGTYFAKVSGDVVPVRITDEKWSGDKHTGWVGVNTQTNRSVRIKSAQRLRSAIRGGTADAGKIKGKAGGEADESGNAAAGSAKDSPTAGAGAKVANAAAKPAAGKKAAHGPTSGKTAKAPAIKGKAAKEPKATKVSALDAAAQVVATAKAPLTAKAIVAEMQVKGLWTSPGGKTPEATVYAAMIREIAAKGKESRFKKHDRGLFAAGKV